MPRLTEKKRCLIQIAVSESDKDALFELAEFNNFSSLSEFIRKTLFDMLQDHWVKHPKK